MTSSNSQNDHIALTLTLSGEGNANNSRKSLRRTWNQLPRCQRNLILLVLTAICLSLLLLLPGEQQRAFYRGKLLSGNDARIVALDEQNAIPLLSEKDASNQVGDNLDSNNHMERPKFESRIIPQQTVKDKQHELENQRHEIVPRIELAPPEASENKISVNAVHLEAPDAAAAPPQSVKLQLNNENALSDIEIREAIESIVPEPQKLPGMKGMTIDELLDNMKQPLDARKQHFHGAGNDRQTAVVQAFQHSWMSYKKFAWGHDNLKPISQTAHDWFGLGLTMIDALDTMYIMGLDDEFREARNWVEESLKFDINRDVNLFETTIRVLGGLLSAYHLSGDKLFLHKSIELGNRLLPCFLSPSGIPYSDANLASLSAHSPKWSPDSSTSEVTTIQLEFRDLSRSTNIPIYEQVVETVNEKVHALEKKNGLVPIFINANTGTFRNFATISLGARGDSYYEYLLKQWIQTGRKENDPLILDYLRAIDGVLTQLMRRTPREQHVYIGELINGKDFKPKMDHLTCYLPGTLLLGHKYGMPDSHLLLARDLLETCYQTYMKQPTQLGPEIAYFGISESDDDIYVKPNDAHNLLRPEFIESLYYFYAITGNRTYQDMGWTIFEAFEKHTKVEGGYSSIGNVKNVLNVRLRDLMESFWLGETLKYFYLLFSDNRKEIDLDKWIFNTEAHPLPIRNH